jgi:large subunit ribosomal protein L21
MYALVEYKGKQYKAEKGALIQVDKIDAEDGQAIDIDTVVLLSDEETVSVGTPYVTGAVVKATVESSFRDKKIIVYKYKRKKDYHRTIGHRQQYTNIRVQDIITA